jgi:GH25 family lysozyme M1 (1,4-beta-N-acetylmuramidase)
MSLILRTAPSMSPLPAYDWTEPPRLQEGDWDCSQESVEWCLWAYSRTPDDSWMEDSMIRAGVIDPAVGCLDSSGAGLADWLNDEYGEYGYVASNQTAVSFDQVAQEAQTRQHPLAIGGAAWYHWSGVRGYDQIMDRLLLANPAPGYKGVYQTMTRSQFAALGGFNMVRLTHPAAESGSSSAGTLPGGIDVSSHQGYVDWSAVKGAGAAFGWTKATGGAWYKNPTAVSNWQGMAAASLQRGAYHYAFESSGQPLPGPGPEAEAAYFLDAVTPHGLARGDMLCLDIEEGPGALGQWALRWCKKVESFVGYPPIIYTSRGFAEAHGFRDVPELARYGLWLAEWSATSMPSPVAPWTHTAFWQFTDKASVPGCSTLVDGNRFNGTAEQLPLWGKPGVLPPEDPYAPWSGLVGSGLLDMMAADGTLPAQSRSTWLPLGVSPADIEQCAGANGINYVWQLTTSQGFRYAPV